MVRWMKLEEAGLYLPTGKKALVWRTGQQMDLSIQTYYGVLLYGVVCRLALRCLGINLSTHFNQRITTPSWLTTLWLCQFISHTTSASKPATSIVTPKSGHGLNSTIHQAQIKSPSQPWKAQKKISSIYSVC